MADLNLELVKQLSSNINRLVDQNKGLKNEVLRMQADHREILAKLAENKRNHAELEEQFKNYRMSRAFSGAGEEMAETRKKINQMVREIDKCIALLNR